MVAVFDDDGWRLKTDPAEHPDSVQSDRLTKLQAEPAPEEARARPPKRGTQDG